MTKTTQGSIVLGKWIGNSWAILFSHPNDSGVHYRIGRYGEDRTGVIKRNVKLIGLSIGPVESKWAGRGNASSPGDEAQQSDWRTGNSAGSRVEKWPRWQIRTTLWTGIVGPPVASFVLLPWLLFGATTSAGSFDLPSYLAAFLAFALPVGYVFGVVPALLAGAIYSLALTAVPSLRSRTMLRLCLGVLVGSVCGGSWSQALMGSDWPPCAAAAALVMGLLALRRPSALRPPPKPERALTVLCGRLEDSGLPAHARATRDQVFPIHCRKSTTERAMTESDRQSTRSH